MEDIKDANIILRLGSKGMEFFTAVYEAAVLFVETLFQLPNIYFYRRQIAEQFYSLTVTTLPVTSIIAIFIGLGSTVQGTYQTSALTPRYFTANVIFKSTILELTPIVLSLVLAGKIGGSLAAEVGSMKISEQIDALESLSLDPVGFLVMPRVLAGTIMLPVMTIFANVLAIFSSFFMSTAVLHWISPGEYVSGMKMGFKVFELYFGNLIKPAIFGFLIAFFGSFFGLRAKGGAKGVGIASTTAVVVSAVLIVILDYFTGELLL